MMSVLIAAAMQPDALCFQLYYDIQSANHTENTVSKLVNEESFKMELYSAAVI